jgi:hypothetical protein
MTYAVRWTEEQLREYRMRNEKPDMRGVDIDAVHKRPRMESKLELRFDQQIFEANLPKPEKNWFFLLGRNFELDRAWPALKVAVEIQGMAHRIKGKFKRDIEKRALAMLAGWTVLEVDGAAIRDGRAIEWLKQLFKKNEGGTDEPSPGDRLRHQNRTYRINCDKAHQPVRRRSEEPTVWCGNIMRRGMIAPCVMAACAERCAQRGPRGSCGDEIRRQAPDVRPDRQGDPARQGRHAERAAFKHGGSWRCDARGRAPPLPLHSSTRSARDPRSSCGSGIAAADETDAARRAHHRGHRVPRPSPRQKAPRRWLPADLHLQPQRVRAGQDARRTRTTTRGCAGSSATFGTCSAWSAR